MLKTFWTRYTQGNISSFVPAHLLLFAIIPDFHGGVFRAFVSSLARASGLDLVPAQIQFSIPRAPSETE
jgi:hypothetical protein